MFVKELSCPYCSAKQNPHGFGQLERVNERNCQVCGKPFVFTVSVHYQTFIEADFSELQTGETPAVDVLKQMVADTQKEETKAYISAEIMTAVSQVCRGYGKKQSMIERFAAKTGYSVSKITNMLTRASMMSEDVATMLSNILEKPFYVETVKSKRGETKEWRIGIPATLEPDASVKSNYSGITKFVYQIGYQAPVEETREITQAEISAYLDHLSKKHKDIITGKPLPVELISINGVKVKKEDAA